MVDGAKSRLVLHFDVNETIMIGDPVAGLDFATSLNNVISKAAFVSKESDTWHDGSPLDPAARLPELDPPPLLTSFDAPADCEQYFARFRRDARWPPGHFTEPGQPGAVYRPLFEELIAKLTWQHEACEILASNGYHFLLPAFFHTLFELTRQRREFSLVIRTFGTDLPEVARSVEAFAAGQHPSFPEPCPSLRMPSSEAKWALRRFDRRDAQSGMSLCRFEGHLSEEGWGSDLAGHLDTGAAAAELSGEAVIAETLSTCPAIGIRDDYHYWRGHKYLPQCGKPLWVTVDDSKVHHIFFDDNIHNKADNSIVAVRARASARHDFQSVSGEATRQLEGVFLVKAHPLEAIRNHDYFLEHIARCESNLAHMRMRGTLHSLLLGGRIQ